MTIAKVSKVRVGAQGFRGTPLQFKVLRAIHRRNPDGSTLDIYQLMEQLGYQGTRQGMSYVLGYLAANGLVEKGPESRIPGGRRARVTFQLTDAGRLIIRPRALPGDTP